MPLGLHFCMGGPKRWPKGAISVQFIFLSVDSRGACLYPHRENN